MQIEKFRGNAGPTLLAGSVAGYILIQIVKWLPLGFVGSFINGILWPIVVLALIAGLGLTVLRLNRAAKQD